MCRQIELPNRSWIAAGSRPLMSEANATLRIFEESGQSAASHGSDFVPAAIASVSASRQWPNAVPYAIDRISPVFEWHECFRVHPCPCAEILDHQVVRSNEAQRRLPRQEYSAADLHLR